MNCCEKNIAPFEYSEAYILVDVPDGLDRFFEFVSANIK